MKKFTALTVLILALLLISSSAKAVGTAAGTEITNQAYADYKDTNGNSLLRVYSNTVTTVVSQVAGVDVSPESSTQTGKQGTTTSFGAVITNTGNAQDSFDLSADNADTWPTRIYADFNANSVRDPGEDSLVSTIGPIPADSLFHVIIEVDIPAGTDNDTQSATTLTARSVFNNTVSDFGTYTVVVQDAVLTITKYVVDSPAFKPGDIITYAIEGNNDGTADAENVTITDAIPANTTYVPGSIKIGPVGGTYATATGMTDGADADAADYNATNPGKVTISWGTAKPKPDASGSGCLYFQVQVNANIPSGTSISNVADINYAIAGNAQPTQQSTPASFTVETLPGVDLSATTLAKSGNPGDTLTYAFTVTNTGNAPDVIDLTYTSTAGVVWTYWVDANGDGIAGNDGDYLLTDSDGDGKLDADSLNQNASRAILAVSTIPAGTPDQAQDVLTVTGTSSLDTNTKDTLVFTSTVTAPVLSVVKSVSPEGAQPPGTVLTYTVIATNNGTGTGTSVIISDMIPQYTTYVANSIKTGSTMENLVSRTDALDGDGAHYDTGSTAVVTSGSALGATGSLVLQFQVTID